MVSTCWCILFLAGMYMVLSYPLDEGALYEDGYFMYPSGSDFQPNYPMVRDTRNYMTKRAHLARKRATLNQLLQKLVEMYGNSEIQFSGRPSHVRFALGGRR